VTTASIDHDGDAKKPTILIAAFSGRALAQSATRAGYAPLVADGFGDEDTLECTQATKRLPSALHAGFRIKSLKKALNTLKANATTPPVGLILGTGFEEHPTLIDALSRDFTILGNTARTVARSKDPSYFLDVLKDLGIAHPKTSLTMPQNPRGWIKKRVGGSGGLHITGNFSNIRPTPDARQGTSNNFYQRVEMGTPISLAGVVSKRGAAFGVCRQWQNPIPRWPYRFGGIVSPIDIPHETEAYMINSGLDLTRRLGLKGFVSFDFMITQTDILLLEINPRPTAALDILDGPQGHMFKAHISACHDQDPSIIVLPRNSKTAPELINHTHAIAYLYADHGALQIPDIAWPSWAGDRPKPGTHVNAHRPLATVSATAKSDLEAENLCRKRLGELENLLYAPGRKD